MKKILTILIILLNTLADSPCAERQLAFPGADGYGRYATGGRGGEVCYVTRLDDCSDEQLVEGTLRWAIRHNNGGRPRTILFATAGTIFLHSKLKFTYPNVSILGQSAPGGGVTITGYNIYVCQDNVILRYLRFRAGDIPDISMTGLDVENARNVIIDHCSMTWSMEECLTAYDTDSTTVQWCIIGEGLYNSKNSKGARAYATQWGGEHSTMHHTLITNSHSRAPRFNGARDAGSTGHDTHVDSEFANNVVYNWSQSGNQYGGEMKSDAEGYNRVYLINNYYRPGPSTQKGTSSGRYWCAPSTPYGQWYLSGNKFETNSRYAPSSTIWSETELNKVNNDNYYGAKDGNASRGINLTGSSFSSYTLSELPYALSGLTYESADLAYQKVTTQAGAALPRYDEVDSRLLAEAAGTTNPKYHGSTISDPGIIDSPSDITLSYPDSYIVNGITYHDMPKMMMETDRFAVDSDADGLPDPYEIQIGLNPLDATDASTLESNGYTRLENYLNGIVSGTIDKVQYETSTEMIEPGAANVPEQIILTFVCTEGEVEGMVPDAITIPYGKDFTIPDNYSLYREGYTLRYWESDGVQFYPGQTYQVKRDRTLTAIFEENKVKLEQRTEDVIVRWDFEARYAPETVKGEDVSGIYVTQATYSGQSHDFCLHYSNNVFTIPCCKGAKVQLNNGTPITIEEAQDCYQLTGPNKRSALDYITVTLPYDWNTPDRVYHKPAIADGADFELIYTTPEVASESDWISGAYYEYLSGRTFYDPVKDDRTTYLILPQSLVFNASDRSLDLFVCGTARIRAFITNQSSSPSNACILTATSTDGSSITARSKVLTQKQMPDIIELSGMDTTRSYRIHFAAENDFDIALGAVKLFPIQGEDIDDDNPEDEKNTDIDADNPKDEYAEIFRDGPFNAVVSDAEELAEALAVAAQSRAERYYIFLRNGEYDFGKRAKTAIPQNTSLIGESQAGVLIYNDPGTVTSNYQELTPVLFIDQNQNNVYLQDLTVRQARDWATKTSQGQAIAIRQRGKQAIYKQVTIQGVQDTYYLNKADGTAYFEDCTIAGEVDFIYGDGTMFFQHCVLNPISSHAFITAPNTQPGYTGIVFDNCIIRRPTDAKDAVTGYHLGRPWGDSPAATFLHTTMEVLPAATGWGVMSQGLTLRFHEFGSKDATGHTLDLSCRSISDCSPATGSDAPVLPESKVADYALDKVFPDWDPQSHTLQLQAPSLTITEGRLSWTKVEGAYCYAIVQDGRVIDFTESTSYPCPAMGQYALRVANQMGGLGNASATIEVDASALEPVFEAIESGNSSVFDLSGRPALSESKGLRLRGGKVIFIR